MLIVPKEDEGTQHIKHKKDCYQSNVLTKLQIKLEWSSVGTYNSLYFSKCANNFDRK